ncbi:hypothetical protein TNCV_4895301 [Trichonephila clavipes]|nr:hypothetical protein TNCV_4895301 [Trichonephila clavipes]
MEERGLQSCQIEAELILEANRLQLMKQDLEKAEGTAERFHFEEVRRYLVLRLHSCKINGKNDYKKKSSKDKVITFFRYNLNLPDYYDDEDDFDRVKDSLTSRLVSKSTETPSTSEKPDVSSDNHSLIPCTEVMDLKYRDFSDLSEQQEALMVEVTIPNCYKQAIRSRDSSKWHDAMDKEINDRWNVKFGI